VHGEREVVGGRAEFHRESKLRDEVGSPGAHEVRAHERLRCLFEQELHKPVGRVHRDGLADRAEGHLADEDLQALRLGLLLREPDHRNLGVREHGARHRAEVRGRGQPRDDLRRHDPLLRGPVREVGRPRAVADREEAGHACRLAVVREDPAALLRALHAERFEAEALDVWAKAHGDEHLVDLDHLRLAFFGRESHLSASGRLLHILGGRLREELDAAGAQGLLYDPRAVDIDSRQHFLQHLDNRNLGPELREERRNLEPDDAAADHDHRLRDRREFEGFFGGDDRL